MFKIEEGMNPDIRVLIVLHSFGEGITDFEVKDIAFPEIEELEKDVEANVNKLRSLEGLQEMASEDVCSYGEVSRSIHKELWGINKKEQYYCVDISLFYKSTESWDGEFDTEVAFKYELVDLVQNWEHLDLIQKGSKIYYIDYEKSNSSYTVNNISIVTDNDYMTSGIYYNVHADNLPLETGYYTVLDDLINAEGSRYYSSPEKAHMAYESLRK